LQTQPSDFVQDSGEFGIDAAIGEDDDQIASAQAPQIVREQKAGVRESLCEITHEP
jgi:hypothetical protein